jgi:hypothetical protein
MKWSTDFLEFAGVAAYASPTNVTQNSDVLSESRGGPGGGGPGGGPGGKEVLEGIDKNMSEEGQRVGKE